MTKTRLKAGKSLEVLVSSIERALANNDKISVESPKHIPDRITGDSREHDVVITVRGSHHKATIAIECRDRSRKITVNDVESFWSKCQDTGIDQGIIVSPKGFTKTAIQKATHKGIRCLQLSEVSSFNWLLASGITTRTRRILHTAWTFFPDQDLVPPPTAFTILSADGEPVQSESLVAAAYAEFQKIDEDHCPVGRGEKRIVFTFPGLQLRDNIANKAYPIVKALAVVQYEVIEEFIPFKLVSYSSRQEGELITDAAVADVVLGGIKGKLMIVYKEGEGGHVVLVPERDDKKSH